MVTVNPTVCNASDKKNLARVSTQGRISNGQVEALKAAGADPIFREKVSVFLPIARLQSALRPV